jgi:hypothetical protein
MAHRRSPLSDNRAVSGFPDIISSFLKILLLDGTRLA